MVKNLTFEQKQYVQNKILFFYFHLVFFPSLLSLTFFRQVIPIGIFENGYYESSPFPWAEGYPYRSCRDTSVRQKSNQGKIGETLLAFLIKH